MEITRLFKDFLRPMLFHCGFHLARMTYRKAFGWHRIFILMYHRVDYQMPPFFEIAVKPDVFEKQMIFLKQHYNIIDLAFLNRIDCHDSEKKDYVVLTFDDGYRDNFLHAYPILRKHRLPATIFLTTDYIGTTRLLWYDQLAWILYTSSSDIHSGTLIKDCIAPEILENVPNFSSSDVKNRIVILRFLASRLKKLPPNDRDAVLRKLARCYNVSKWPGDDERAMLSWEEVKQMTAEGISFGSHTISHPVLSALTEQEARREVSESRRMIEEQIQKPVNTFAYPYGNVEDYHTDFIFRLLEEEGYEYACSTESGSEDPAAMHPLKLKRKGVSSHPYFFL